MRRILVCGGVTFADEELLTETLDRVIADEKVMIVSGGAKGADALAEKYAKDRNIKIKVFPAEWKKYGKGAGPIRNRQMLDFVSQKESPLVVAFWNGKSRGTKNTIETARKMEIATLVADYKDKEE